MTRNRPVLPPHWWTSDDGGLTAFVVPFVLGLLVLAGLALDGGLTLAAKARANGQAEAAARAGAQAIDLMAYRDSGTLQLLPAEAITKAQEQMAAGGATGTVTVSGDTVTVTVTASQPTELLGLIGIDSLSVQGHGNAHPERE
jgi:hypothetical protein